MPALCTALHCTGGGGPVPDIITHNNTTPSLPPSLVLRYENQLTTTIKIVLTEIKPDR